MLLWNSLFHESGRPNKRSINRVQRSLHIVFEKHIAFCEYNIINANNVVKIDVDKEVAILVLLTGSIFRFFLLLLGQLF